LISISYLIAKSGELISECMECSVLLEWIQLTLSQSSAKRYRDRGITDLKGGSPFANFIQESPKIVKPRQRIFLKRNRQLCPPIATRWRTNHAEGKPQHASICVKHNPGFPACRRRKKAKERKTETERKINANCRVAVDPPLPRTKSRYRALVLFAEREVWYEAATRAIEARIRAAALSTSVTGTMPPVGVARGVVLFVGDGMGMSTLTAARILSGQRHGNPGEESQLAWDSFPAVALARVSTREKGVPGVVRSFLLPCRPSVKRRRAWKRRFTGAKFIARELPGRRVWSRSRLLTDRPVLRAAGLRGKLVADRGTPCSENGNAVSQVTYRKIP
jgi:hypothetical protein